MGHITPNYRFEHEAAHSPLLLASDRAPQPGRQAYRSGEAQTGKRNDALIPDKSTRPIRRSN
jgi:hypothetical protein